MSVAGLNSPKTQYISGNLLWEAEDSIWWLCLISKNTFADDKDSIFCVKNRKTDFKVAEIHLGYGEGGH